MGCWDVFCIICGNPCHSIPHYYIDDINENLDEDIKKKPKNIINNLKELDKNTKWMNNCTMLLLNDKIYHGFNEIACNITFCKNNLCITHIGNWTKDFDYSFTNDIICGIFIHTDCWKFIKKIYKIELKFSNLPKIKKTNNWNKIFNINYGNIEKYWNQDFNFMEIIIDKKNYLCSSPLKNDKNIAQIKKNIAVLKIKNDPKRIGPLVSATFYDNGDIKLGKNNFFWIKKNNKWLQINEKPLKINININLQKLNKKQKNFLTKIPFIGQHNTIPIFILSSILIKKNIYNLELLLIESYKNKLSETINKSL